MNYPKIIYIYIYIISFVGFASKIKEFKFVFYVLAYWLVAVWLSFACSCILRGIKGIPFKFSNKTILNYGYGGSQNILCCTMVPIHGFDAFFFFFFLSPFLF